MVSIVSDEDHEARLVQAKARLRRIASAPSRPLVPRFGRSPWLTLGVALGLGYVATRYPRVRHLILRALVDRLIT